MAYLGSKPANILTDPVIADGSISSAKLANNAVTYAKLDSNLQQSGMRNRIINGAMTIDQRNNGASGTAIGYTVDRWNYYGTQASKLTWQQNAGSVTPPAGFKNYLGITSSSAYSVTAGDVFILRQFIEGFNFADCEWGTANAKPVTLSFWVRSSLTGTFAASLYNADGTRSYPVNYTISSANTWEYKSITIAGDTTGTWLTNNGVGNTVNFSLGAGSSFSGTSGAWASAWYPSATGATSVVGTNGAIFYITGVQLEKGTQATSFEYRQYGTELALCQRYFYKMNVTSTTGGSFGGGVQSASRCDIVIRYPVDMRATPTFSATGTIAIDDYFAIAGNVGSFDAQYMNNQGGFLVNNMSSGSFVTGRPVKYTITGSAYALNISAEL